MTVYIDLFDGSYRLKMSDLLLKGGLTNILFVYSLDELKEQTDKLNEDPGSLMDIVLQLGKKSILVSSTRLASCFDLPVHLSHVSTQDGPIPRF